MNDDWRLQIDLHRTDHAGALAERLVASDLKHDLSHEFYERVVVTQDGPTVFLYAGTRDQAERARRAVESEAQGRPWSTSISLRRWHPSAEEWENPDLLLPIDAGDLSAERERLVRREREETAKNGYPEFEVRVDLKSHRDAVLLSGCLQKEGIPSVRRWRYLLVGAADEDSARTLAKHIQEGVPNGTHVRVEGTWAAVSRKPTPFAVHIT